jgi:nucleoid DNA-binding protein
MNKKELIEYVFEKLQKKISRKVVTDVVNGFMDGILHSVSIGEPVKLVGFLNINLKHYGERESRNPKTGQTSTTPPVVKALAKLGTTFKDAAKKVKPIVPKGTKAKK